MDRTFRNAWVTDGDAVAVDMDKARDLHRDNLRRDRGPMLADLDVQFMRSIESGQPTSDIVSRKQLLRDATIDPRIDAAKTPEALLALDIIALLET